MLTLPRPSSTSLLPHIQGGNCTFVNQRVKTGDILFSGVDLEAEGVSLADAQDYWKGSAGGATGNRTAMKDLYDLIPALEYP